MLLPCGYHHYYRHTCSSYCCLRLPTRPLITAATKALLLRPTPWLNHYHATVKSDNLCERHRIRLALRSNGATVKATRHCSFCARRWIPAVAELQLLRLALVPLERYQLSSRRFC